MAIQRRTPLRAKKPLRGGGGLKRSPLGRSSKGFTPKPYVMSAEEVLCREQVKERSQGLCEGCGRVRATDMAHRVARSGGGEWSAENMMYMCRACHSYNHDNPSEAYEKGQHLKSFQDPAVEPVLYRGHWIVLLPGGGWKEAEEVL